MELRKIRVKDILTKRNVKRLLAVLAVITIAVVLAGCTPADAGHQAPISHTNGNWVGSLDRLLRFRILIVAC